jgi:hypothetical protein
MGKETAVSTVVEEVRSSSQCSSREELPKASVGPSNPALVAEWPSAPQPLQPSKLSRVLNTTFDVVIALAPLLLLVKAGLVVEANKIDGAGAKTGSISDPPSSMTVYLLSLNGQVSPNCLVLREKAHPLTAGHPIHHHLRYHHWNMRQAIRVMEG